MALDDAAVLEVLEAMKTAGVDERGGREPGMGC
ncbi:hypothetical protein SAMN05421756_105201 [Microlunatus flavus]|uniref:Uncharacterized protein n=1 Tax=Microlunatus flavus TaxID=1036181 RepID=A0A1H9IDQ0_9ACTN|nr:hypothetical protein SAMN05421756_105201 [Microlunatus flavus]